MIQTQIDYNSWVAISTSLPFLISLLVVWFLPILLYLFIGALIKGTGSSSRHMISYPNFWYGVAIWTIFQGMLFIGIIFPVWLKFI